VWVRTRHPYAPTLLRSYAPTLLRSYAPTLLRSYGFIKAVTESETESDIKNQLAAPRFLRGLGSQSILAIGRLPPLLAGIKQPMPTITVFRDSLLAIGRLPPLLAGIKQPMPTIGTPIPLQSYGPTPLRSYGPSVLRPRF